MKTRTKKETVLKYQLAIQQMVDFVKSKNGSIMFRELFAIAKSNKVSWTCVDGILKTKIIEKPYTGYFKVNIDKIEPIHARKVIELKNANQVQKRKEKLEQQKKSTPKEPLLKQTRTFKIKKETIKEENIKEDKKTISILWGLIKINYK